ncbi:MAG: MBL fold metallo-hydrolase [Candidatus Hodarchaeaceae archaeon]|nr:MBL fold metallo-hydrolase [Candidatus Hodarchaeaceae archaeon]
MKIHQIGGLGPDSNIYLIIDEIITLIDAGTGQNFKNVKHNLSKFNLKPSDVGLLINTHCHFDHTGGDWDFVAAGCEVAIHEFEAGLLRDGEQTITMAGSFGRRLEPVEVARELREGDRVKLGELTLQVVHTPGHTQGSISLYEHKRGILFSGDTVFCDGVGRTDLPTSNAKALARSLRKLSALDVESLYPGHGPFVERGGHRCILEAIGLVS